MAGKIVDRVSATITGVVNGAKGWVAVNSIIGFYKGAYVTISAPGLSKYAQIIDIAAGSLELRIKFVPDVGSGPSYHASDVSGYGGGTVAQESQLIYNPNDNGLA